jgi:hypothetical protein
MSFTDSSNGKPKGFPLLWLSNAVSSYWPSLLAQSRCLQLLFLRVIPGPSGIITRCASPMPSPRVSQLTKLSVISAFGRQGRLTGYCLFLQFYHHINVWNQRQNLTELLWRMWNSN